MKKSFQVTLSAFLILALGFAGGVGGAVVYGELLSGDVTASTDPGLMPRVEKQVYIEESQVIDAVKQVSPSVVSIIISKDLPLYRNRVLPFNDPFFDDPFFNFPFEFGVPQQQQPQPDPPQRQRRQVGGGSGFVISDDGLIATNRHVVDDPDASYTVILNDGRTFEVSDIHTDPINDFAVIQIVDENGKKPAELPVAPLGDSDLLEPGQRVVAIGNALSEYENTVTTGVVSAKGRSLTAGSIRSTESLINLIQTDASINPGNSGGPLVNLNGEVVGVNTAIAANAQGIGFAIPSNDVKNIIESVREAGEIVRPYLGVRFMMLDVQRAEELGIKVEQGALLVGDESSGEFAVIPGSPADQAGLQRKDVILEVEGEKVTPDKPLHLIIGAYRPDETVDLNVWRSGETQTISVTLGQSD
jgi:serine protease Do